MFQRTEKLRRLIKLLLIIIITSSTIGVTVEPSGAYNNLVIAIDENSLQTVDPNFFDNLKFVLSRFSAILHIITWQTFYLEKVTILVPSHWKIQEEFIEEGEGPFTATEEIFDTADVKLSHNYGSPRVSNVHPCGQKGESIQLPLWFFDHKSSSVYGGPERVLIPLWARYRWGVWEEHGYPGDLRFPYFNKNGNFTGWSPTGCSNAEIAGTVRNLNQQEGDKACEGSFYYRPSSTCRFYPYERQTSTTSLMQYYWHYDIQQFCDDSNHLMSSPNRQNFYCHHKSVKSIIQGTEDYRKVMKPSERKQTKFRFVKSTPKPLLYFLLDSGPSTAPPAVLKTVITAMANLVLKLSELPSDDAVVGKVGIYPYFAIENMRNGNLVVLNTANWTTINKENSEKFVAILKNALRDGRTDNQSKGRNFGHALNDVIRSIELRRLGGLPTEAKVLLCKTASKYQSENILWEFEVLAKALANGVQVYGIELEGNALRKGTNLKQLCEKSCGRHLVLGPSEGEINLPEIERQVTLFLESMMNLTDKKTPESSHMLITSRSYEFTTEKITFPVASEGFHKVHFYIKLSRVKLQLPRTPLLNFFDNPEGDGRSIPVDLVTILNWEEESTCVHGIFENIAYSEISYFTLEGECEDPEECKVFVITLGENQIGSIVKSNMADLDIKISSAGDNDVMYMRTATAASYHGVAGGIFAEIRWRGNSISFLQQEWTKSGVRVEAEVSYFGMEGEFKFSKKIELKDDGQQGATGDISKNDGIFSGIFIPASEDRGMYRVTVHLTYLSSSSQTKLLIENNLKNLDSNFPKALFQCGSDGTGCVPFVPQFPITFSKEGFKGILVVEPDQFKYVPYRIWDLKATPLDDYIIELTWTAPGCHRFDRSGNINNYAVQSYEVKYSEASFEALWNDFEGANEIDNIRVEEPGYKHKYIFDRTGYPTEVFFAIRPLQENFEFDDVPLATVSNIVSAVTLESPEPTTTTLAPIPTTKFSTQQPSTTISTGQSTTTTSNNSSPKTDPWTPPSTTPHIPTFTSPNPTTESVTGKPPKRQEDDSEKPWNERPEGIFIIVLGSVMVVIVFVGFGFYYWKFLR